MSTSTPGRLWRLNSTEDRRGRPFGSQLAPLSVTYLLYLPFLLGTTAGVIWLLPSYATFIFGAVVGGLAGLYVLAETVFQAGPLRLTTIYGMTVLLGYNLGAANSWVTEQRGPLTLAESFARDPAALARGVAASMAVAAMLFAVGQLYERPIFGNEFRLGFGLGTTRLVVLSTALLLGAYATGQIGYMGISVGEGGEVKPATALIMYLVIPAFAYSVCAALNTRGTARLTIIACVITQTAAMVPLGRRIFGFAVLLALIATRLGRYRLRISFFKKVLLLAAGMLLVVCASALFLYLRIAGYSHKGKLAIGERLGEAYVLAQTRDPVDILANLGNDASHRSFLVGFFSDLLDASQRSTPLLGRDMVYNLKMAIPSVLSRDKLGLEPYQEEMLVDMQWGFSYIDEANSLLTAGAADFGIIGVFLYPLLVIFLARLVIEWMQWVAPGYVAAIVALSFIYQTLQAEDVPIAYFIQVRNAVLIALVAYLLNRLPHFRLRPES